MNIKIGDVIKYKAFISEKESLGRVKEIIEIKDSIDKKRNGSKEYRVSDPINQLNSPIVKEEDIKSVYINIAEIKTDEVPGAITEEILKEYAEDLYEEFNQVAICEGKITMKDVADILHLNK